MTIEDAAFIAELQAKLTPDYEAALTALCDAMPDASDDALIDAFRDHFPELLERHRETLGTLGLASMIVERKELHERHSR